MGSNRRNAPLWLVSSFFMLDDVELNHNGEQYILVQNERNSIHLHRLNNNESYVIMCWLLHKTYLFGDTHQWMSSYQNIREHLNI